MQDSEIEVGGKYAVREKVSIGEPLIEVQVLEKTGRRGQIKIRRLSDPHKGLEEFLKTRQFIVPWAERQAFLRDERLAQRLEETRTRPDQTFVDAIETVFAASGYDVWEHNGKVEAPASALREMARLAGLPQNRATYFVAAPSAQDLLTRLSRSRVASTDSYALAAQAGAHLVAAHADFDRVDVYARDEHDAELIASQLDARPAHRGANLLIMIPYYRISAFFGRQRVQGLVVTSDLQLYLDLYYFPVRGREEAEHLHAQRLAPKLRALEERPS